MGVEKSREKKWVAQKLIKPTYTLDEALSYLHKKYPEYDLDMDWLQDNIASGQLIVHLGLKDTYLFPVSKINEVCEYLELFDYVKKAKDVRLDQVHENNEDVLRIRQKERVQVYFSGLIGKPNCIFVNKNTSRCLYRNKAPSEQLLENEVPLLEDLKLSMLKPYDLAYESKFKGINVIDSCRLKTETYDPSAIIRINCTQPVIPYFSIDSKLGISFIQPDLVNELKKVNLSSINRSVLQELSFSSVVKWDGQFFYVLNLNSSVYQGEDISYFSISSDVLKSYESGAGLIILRENLKQFEKNVFEEEQTSSRSSNINSIKNENQNSNLVKLSEYHEHFLNAFADYEEFKERGVKIQQDFIKAWLKEQPIVDSDRRVLKELINQKYKITSGRVKNPLLTIC